MSYVIYFFQSLSFKAIVQFYTPEIIVLNKSFPTFHSNEFENVHKSL